MSSDEAITATTWRRAAACAASSCVEVAADQDEVLLRDSKHPGLTPFRFSRSEFAEFLRGAKSGEFDDLIE